MAYARTAQTLVLSALFVLPAACAERGGGGADSPLAGGSTGAAGGASSVQGGNGGTASGSGPSTAGSLAAVGSTAGGFVVDNTSADAFDRIPPSYIQAAHENLRIFYAKLSHGSQVTDGLGVIETHLGNDYNFGFLTEYYGSVDPGRDIELGFADVTRTELAAGNYNVVMWAFSSNLGAVDYGTEEYIAGYLRLMEELEAEFPDVRFVYFTGPAKTYDGADGTMARNNAILRDYATGHGKILLDNEALDLYDPEGTYHEDGTDGCEWCAPWCEARGCNDASFCDESCGCEAWNHTHRFQCFRKGQAFWYLAARLAGWSGQ